MHGETRLFAMSALTCTVAVAMSALVSCSSSDGSRTLTLLAYDSFTVPADAFSEFTQATGIRVELAIGGDAGEIAAKAALTAGNPEGDVFWGADNALLERLVEAQVFEPYSSGSAPIPDRLRRAAGDVVTPVDFGYVCVNYDVEALEKLDVDPPRSFDDLVRPEYSGLLVVPNATTSSPGLAFLLATRAAFEDDWDEYWTSLVDNDVAFTQSWTDAYYTRFSRHGGDRPMVVSYSTSPPAEVLFADPPLPPGSPAPTAVATGTCFEQIEFAGIMRGTDDPRGAELLIDFLISREFQEMLPETLFVYPANEQARLPASFEAYAEPISDAWSMTSQDIARSRVELLDEWSRITGL